MQLDLEVENPALSTHEGLRIGCRLSGAQPPAMEIPGPYDRSGAFRIRLLNGSTEPLRIMTRQTRQRLMTEGRVDSSPDLDMLEPRQAWNWKLDLASFHYPIPPGDFLLDAHYDYPPADLSLQSPRHTIRVMDAPLNSIEPLRDNPVIDGLWLLLEAEGSAGPEYFLRLHTYARPIAAWYSRRILVGQNAQAPFCAFSNYYQTASSEPFHERWVLWTSDGSVNAQLHSRGAATDNVRSAPMPEDSTIVRSAFRTDQDELYVFLWAATGLIECHRLEASRLVKIFEYHPRAMAGSPVSVGADREFIHLATPWRGVFYERLTLKGKPLERLHAVRTLLKPMSLTYDSAVHRIKAAFADPPHGRSVLLADIELRKDLLSQFYTDRLAFHGDLNELSFDRDDKGRFHTLVSTTGSKLFYCSEERGPVLVAEGEDRFFPIVVAPAQVYLGCYRGGYGYRFLQYRRLSREAKLVGLGAHS